MPTPSHRKYHKRSITVDFHDDATSHQVRKDGDVFVEFVVAFMTSLGFHLVHNGGCPGGGR